MLQEEEMLESAFLEDQKEMEEGQDILTKAMTWRGTEGKHPGGENPNEGTGGVRGPGRSPPGVELTQQETDPAVGREHGGK